MNNIMEKRLSEANDLREAEKYGDSAKAYTECLIDLIKNGDQTGLIHCLGGQSLIYKILIRSNNSPIYRQLTLSFAKGALDVAESNLINLDGRVVAIAYRCYGDALLMDDKPQVALPYFEKAFSITTAGIPEKGNLKAHIGSIKYLLGEKELGKNIIEEALDDIRTGDPSVGAYRTWETGCLNGLAKIYAIENNPDKATDTIKLSLDIATDHNLPIRKREAEEILEKISSGKIDFSI